MDKGHLRLYVEDYYREQLKTAQVKNNTIQFYKSLRGYFKHSIRLTDIKREEFTATDYMLWDTLLTNVKSSSDVLVSGGLYFRFKEYGAYCCESSFYTSRKKYVDLGLLIVTPFKGYYIINPEYIIKVYIEDNLK